MIEQPQQPQLRRVNSSPKFGEINFDIYLKNQKSEADIQFNDIILTQYPPDLKIDTASNNHNTSKQNITTVPQEE